MKGLKNISFYLLLSMAISNGFAQMIKVEKAMDLYGAKKLDSAKTIIDEAIQNPESAKDYQTWMVRGYVYKELYKANESKNPASPLRDSSAVSLVQSIQLDADGKNPQRDKVIQSLKYIAASYHNDINKTLDTVGYKQALINSDKHKAIMKLIDPAFDEKKYNYEVYSTIGSMFEKWYEQKTSKTLLDMAKTYLLKAYEMNNNTDFINKNLGVLYYNQAVDIIKKMDYDVPLDQLPVYQDQSIKLGQQSLPYLLKANQINPSDKSVIEGLAGIYYLLNDTEKYNEYKKKFEELNKQ
jgi:tetratricopeptide (TPR) repeat protein